MFCTIIVSQRLQVLTLTGMGYEGMRARQCDKDEAWYLSGEDKIATFEFWLECEKHQKEADKRLALIANYN